MSQPNTKSSIIEQSVKAFDELTNYIIEIKDRKFFLSPGNNKWSIAENIIHLIKSTQTTALACSLPKFVIKIVAGKPNRPSRSYEELLEKYELKLQQGGRASSRYVPKPLSKKISKEKIIYQWQIVTGKYLKALDKNWNEQTLDSYIAPHPLLGKITFRELAYFTLFHTHHHFRTIRQLEIIEQ
jgi:DinB superfamily